MFLAFLRSVRSYVSRETRSRGVREQRGCFDEVVAERVQRLNVDTCVDTVSGMVFHVKRMDAAGGG